MVEFNEVCKTSIVIDGEGYADCRDQAKKYFGLWDQEVPEPRKPQYCETGKLDLVKFLRDFERRFYRKYNQDTGTYDCITSLIDCKKFVEEKFGL